MLTTLCFDADDTLWHNERFFQLTQEKFVRLLAEHASSDDLADRLLEAERRNLGQYGFGIKGFVLSMIETALDVTNDQVPGSVIREIVAAGQDMLRHPIDLLDGVMETIGVLAPAYDLVLITKGDLLDQERKLAQSGLGEWFDAIEIVSAKEPDTYSEILSRRKVCPASAVMIGNSVKSDILPMLEIGGWAVHVPHGVEWAIEAAKLPSGHHRLREITSLGQLPEAIYTMQPHT